MQGIIVNPICPGYVNTDMTSGRGTKTLREGADTRVWVALRAQKDAQTGVFYQDRAECDGGGFK
jgi:carbonyl reductase 1